MHLTRRNFVQLSFKTVVTIGLGNTLQSFSANTFSLPPRYKVSFRFAIASDGHYGQKDTQYGLFHDQMVDWLNVEKRQRGIDFTMINGDLFHDDPAFLTEIKARYGQLKMPFYVSHGNHDKTPEAVWQNAWGVPFHYAFEKKGTAFLVLNTADETGKYICPDLEWTREHLNRYAKSKRLFVFMHITPFKWTENGIACPELVELFNKQSNLKAIFHGHDHDNDGVKENEGRFYFFDSHIGGNWGTAYRGYRIVECLTTGEIITYQMNPATLQKVNGNNL